MTNHFQFSKLRSRHTNTAYIFKVNLHANEGLENSQLSNTAVCNRGSIQGKGRMEGNKNIKSGVGGFAVRLHMNEDASIKTAVSKTLSEVVNR